MYNKTICAAAGELRRRRPTGLDGGGGGGGRPSGHRIPRRRARVPFLW